MFSLEIYGRDGKISVDGLGGSYGTEKITYYRMLPQMGPPETEHWEFPASDGSWEEELKDFEQDIRLRRRASPGLQEGIRTLEIVEAIYKKSGYPTL
jgi:predicted dehydrogenase